MFKRHVLRHKIRKEKQVADKEEMQKPKQVMRMILTKVNVMRKKIRHWHADILHALKNRGIAR